MGDGVHGYFTPATQVVFKPATWVLYSFNVGTFSLVRYKKHILLAKKSEFPQLRPADNINLYFCFYFGIVGWCGFEQGIPRSKSLISSVS